jgi:tetratricopeptide (TPR) repeat protein
MRESILKALELDDTLSEAHASFGLMKMYYMEWDDAEREFLKAIQLNPGSEAAHHWYGHLLMFLGKFEEGIGELKKARDLDPLSVMINGCVGMNLREVGRNKEAIEVLERTIALDPNFPGAHGSLGLAYLAEGIKEKAMVEFENEKEVAARGEIIAEGYIGHAYAMMGETDKARQVLNNIMNQAEEGHVPESWIAGILFTIGEEEKGFEWLDKARKNGDMHLPFIRINPAFESVRSDPRYRAVLKKLKLEP